MKSLIKKIIPKRLLSLYHLFFAWCGSVIYRKPSEKLLVIGVTGTTGKSTTVYLMRKILENSGYKVGSMSTIDFYVAGKEKLNDKKMTMLGKMQIQKYLRKMVDEKCNIAIIETTSEGLLQHRHRFINYDMLVVTNLYPEHIESHGSFENYKRAKLEIARYVAGCKSKILKDFKTLKFEGNNSVSITKTLILNANSEHSPDFAKIKFDNFLYYERNDQKKYLDINHHKNLINLVCKDIKKENHGFVFRINENEIKTKLYGEHNIMNIIAGLAPAYILGSKLKHISHTISKIDFIPGRIELIKSNKDFQVIVDYAFEPVALSALYNSIKQIKHKRIIHVCGSAGGGRDKSRRKLIGQLVGEKSDICIVTNEDPYDEDPVKIIKDVSSGAIDVGKKQDINLFEIIDREKAIEKAILLAGVGDLILITGKGSEQGMCIVNGKIIPWDDRKIVSKYLKK